VAIPVVIDTDPGIDDAVALWWALTSPALDLIALTAVHGNVGVELAAANAARILHAAGRPDIPVAVGEATALGLAPVRETPAWIHGADGLGEVGLDPAPFGPVAEPASTLLARLVRERPGELAVVALGPLSNLAAVIRADPEWAPAVGRLVVMGGSVAVGGNATPAAEANIAHDPDAAAMVLGAPWSSTPLLVTLDATHEATLGGDELALAREHRTPAAAFCDEPLRFYRNAVGSPTGECSCHDLLAVLALEDPTYVGGDVVPVAVHTGAGPAWGAVVVDRRRGREPVAGFCPWRVSLGADVRRFRSAARRLFGG
jgi:inosine-uridine nucleoside N-ribohydrolase